MSPTLPLTTPSPTLCHRLSLCVSSPPRNELQLQNEHLQKELQDMRSQHSGGNRLPAASLSLLVLLLPGMLLL